MAQCVTIVCICFMSFWVKLHVFVRNNRKCWQTNSQGTKRLFSFSSWIIIFSLDNNIRRLKRYTINRMKILLSPMHTKFCVYPTAVAISGKLNCLFLFVQKTYNILNIQNIHLKGSIWLLTKISYTCFHLIQYQFSCVSHDWIYSISKTSSLVIR